MRSGGFYLDAGTAGGPHSGNMGNNGQFWSSRSDSTTANAYNLNFNASNVNPSNSNDRWRGYPLRCLFVAMGADLLALNKKEGILLYQYRYAYASNALILSYDGAAVNDFSLFRNQKYLFNVDSRML